MIKGYNSNIETSRQYFKIGLVAWTDLRTDKTKAIAESVSMKEYCWHLDIAVENNGDGVICSNNQRKPDSYLVIFVLFKKQLCIFIKDL